MQLPSIQSEGRMRCFTSTADEHVHQQQKRKEKEDSPEAEIKNESVTPAIRQTHTEQPCAVQCRAPLRNSVFLITEIGAQVSEELHFQNPQSFYTPLGLALESCLVGDI